MNVATANTNRGRVARYAIGGAVLLNIVTVVWAFHSTVRTTVIAAVALTIVGGAIGASVGWATAANRWGRWWGEGRTHRGSIRGRR